MVCLSCTIKTLLLLTGFPLGQFNSKIYPLYGFEPCTLGGIIIILCVKLRCANVKTRDNMTNYISTIIIMMLTKLSRIKLKTVFSCCRSSAHLFEIKRGKRRGFVSKCRRFTHTCFSDLPPHPPTHTHTCPSPPHTLAKHTHEQ